MDNYGNLGHLHGTVAFKNTINVYLTSFDIQYVASMSDHIEKSFRRFMVSFKIIKVVEE